MGILAYLLAAAVHLLAVAVDLAVLLLLAHLLAGWRAWRPLVAIDRVGAPLVDYLAERADHLWRRVAPNHWLSDRQKVALLLALACLVKLALGVGWKAAVLS